MFRLPHRLLSSFRSNSHAAWTSFFVVALLVIEQQSIRSTSPPQGLSDVALRLAVVEAFKLLSSLVYYYWKTHQSSTKARRDEEDNVEGQPLTRVNGFYEHTFDRSPAVHLNNRWHSSQNEAVSRIALFFSLSLTSFVAALFVLTKYDLSYVQHFHGPFATNLSLSASTILTLLGLFSLFAWTVEAIQYQAVLGQFSGFLVIFASSASATNSHNAQSLFLLPYALSLSLVVLTIIYRTQHNISLEALHVFLFALSLIIHLMVLAVHPSSAALTTLPHTRFSFWLLCQCFAQALMELTGLVVIHELDAPSAGVSVSLAAALHLLVVVLTSGVFTPYVILGCVLIIISGLTYLVYRRDEDNDRLAFRTGHGAVFVLQMIGVAFFLVFGLFFAISSSNDSSDLRYSDVKPATITDIITDSLVTCRRKPLLSADWYPYERTYHKFDDILLIVFFSHARYDVNLDSYREVYSEFFPNMIFIGPRSRQDAGFNHSYDVLVDSYEADEDLHDPFFYKMAGRMAHHMLHTALDTYPCYEGYLWAPFDTLLNIPRLQQFDQNYFWYHSPFGTFVPNPALGDEVANANKSRHAPPLNISPDPELNLTATWKGWQTDWWWGDPHVGVEVCMQAFRKIPLSMRENLATLTNGTTRLLGGSADTLYIPGRHRQVFLETLATFLETMCFLEIATPTAVHLVLPPNEPILFVDHWWIWKPPFNATFVRSMWADGFEVDTFHTFHWGDMDEDGVWRGNAAHVSDVRKLLAQSAVRQQIEFPLHDLSVYRDE